MSAIRAISREAAARELRMALADERYGPPADHVDNGEENEYRIDGELSYIANFSKGLPHNELGEVAPDDYRRLIGALSSGDPDDFERIPFGTPRPSGPDDLWPRKLTNPQAGLAFDLEGPDAQSLTMPPAPRIDSAETAAEMGELYWMALLRDVPFTEYDTNGDIATAAASLTAQFSDFRGPKEKSGKVVPRTLFRGITPGDCTGPYVSQFLLRGTAYPGLGLSEDDGEIRCGTLRIVQKQGAVEPGKDFLVSFAEWLAVQNGEAPRGGEKVERTPRFIRNLRDLAHYTHCDQLCQPYLNAALILLQLDAAHGPMGAIAADNYYVSSSNQLGYATFGAPHLLGLICEVATRALRAVWFQKWFVHRRLRPEAFGGLVHLHKSGRRLYPINAEILDETSGSVLERIRWHNRRKHNLDSYLLPQAFAEGSPMHPAYGAGHAAVAGACVTVLKAWFDESFPLREAFVPDKAGKKLVPYAVAGAPLTVGGELAKLAANLSIARSAGGVSWRSDCIEALKLGEALALGILRDQKQTYNEPAGFKLAGFNGTQIVI